MNTNATVNFQNPFDKDQYFKEYLEAKELHLRKKSQARRPRQKHMHVLVFVLMSSMVILGIISLLQYRQLQDRIASLNQQVAGVNESSTSTSHTISAEGFTLVLKSPAPEGFVLERSTGTSEYLIGKPAITTRFAHEVEENNGKLFSGIDVEVIEYDNAMDSKAFANAVLKKLGNTYFIATDSIQIPKDIKLTQIRKQGDTTMNTVYYTAVTTDNYYVIRVYNQLDASRYADTARFTDSLITNLYLN